MGHDEAAVGDTAANRELWTRANREYGDDHARRAWAAERITWGIFNVPEEDLGVLGDVRGLEVVELGCGTAYFSAWLARRGARPTGVDVTPAQLESARSCQQREARRQSTAHNGVQFHPSHGEWITILRASGFTIDGLREVYAPPDAPDHPYYQLATTEWARQWPVEEIWTAHLTQ
jgi:SAM-dependent methyltransferase